MNTILFSQGVFDWVWKTSIAAAILTVLVFVVQWLLGKRLTPRLHYALSLLVLIRLLLPAVPASSWSLDHFLPQKTRIAQPTFVVTAPRVNPTPTIQHPEAATTFASAPIQSSPKESLSIPCLAWIFGCLALLVFAAWRYQKLACWLKQGEIITDTKLCEMLDEARKEMGVRRQVTALFVSQAASPAVFGIWNVRLLLPRNILNGLSEQEIRFVLRHEMAHVRRNDTLLNTLLMAVQFLHWFNPLVWLALHRIRADRETICDELVMRHTDAEERAHYGRLLLKLMEEFPAGQRLLPNTAAMVGDKHEIKRRILMIKNHGRKRLAGAMFAVVAIALLGCASFTHSETSTASATQPKSTVVTAPPSADVQGPNNPTFSVVAKSTDGSGPFTYQWNFNTNANSSDSTKLLVANNSNSSTSASTTMPSSSGSAVAVVSADNSPLVTTLPITVTTGTPPLSYQWHFDSNNNVSGTTLVVTNNSNSSTSTSTTVPTSSGSTVAVVTRDNRSAGATAPITTNFANFTVAATGTAPLYYQWYTTSNLPTGTVTLGSDSYQAPSLASQLVGTWVLEREDGPQSSPSGVGIRMKNFTGTHWDMIQPDPKTGQIIFHQGGTYKIEGDTYFEHKDFAGEHNKGGIGKTGKFTLKIEGDKLIQTGVNNDWNEVWKRVN